MPKTTTIDGLEVHRLTVHEDNRGWFKENWSGQKLTPKQHNVSFNAKARATRGMHAEPWDKWVSVSTGRVFGAWVDMREGSATFGEKFTCEIGPDTAVFVPRGVANGFQALEDNTTYIYLVNQRYSPGGAFCSYKEIDWPLEPTELSAKDLEHPMLADAAPLPPRRILVTGANGQLGRALRQIWSEEQAHFVGHDEFDITNPPSIDWADYWAIVNCAAYNDVNGALAGAGVTFTPQGSATLALGADGAFTWTPAVQLDAAVSGTTIVVTIGGDITGSYSATSDRITTANQSTDNLQVSATIDGAETDAGSITQEIAGAPVSDASYTCAGDTLTLVSQIGGSPATSVLHRG